MIWDVLRFNACVRRLVAEGKYLIVGLFGLYLIVSHTLYQFFLSLCSHSSLSCSALYIYLNERAHDRSYSVDAAE